jgi:hypothetical protein
MNQLLVSIGYRINTLAEDYLEFGNVKRNADAKKKASEVGNKSKADTKPLTIHEQRIQKNTWSLRSLTNAAGIGLTLAMAEMTGHVVADQS